MSESLISADPSLTLINRESLQEAAKPNTEKSAMAADVPFASTEWKLMPVEPATVITVVAREPVKISPLPQCATDFIKAVAQLPGVQCIIAEEGESGTIHVTTFAEPLNPELEKRIYDAEYNAISSNPGRQFDFHTRRVSEAKGRLSLSAGQHYFGVWGSLDAAP
jgi:hypothetical protein